MPKPVSGQCLCQTIRYEITGQFDGFYLCHCHRCQQSTGSAHAANLFSSQAEVNWLTGEEYLRHYRIPKTAHQKSFCSLCGAPLPNYQSQHSVWLIPAGSLTMAVPILPTAHIFMADKADWEAQIYEIPQYLQFPKP